MAQNYDVDQFEPPPSPEFVCVICQNVLCKPQECPCRHVFCSLCIETWLSTRQSCPTCRKRIKKQDLVPVLPMVQNLLNVLLLKCSNYHNGCTELISLEFYNSHTKTCPNERLECPYKQCGSSMLRRDLVGHKTSCQYRLIQCESWCKLDVVWKDRDNHDCRTAVLTMLQEEKEQHEELERMAATLRTEKADLERQLAQIKARLAAVTNRDLLEHNSVSTDEEEEAAIHSDHSEPDLWSDILSDSEVDVGSNEEFTTDGPASGTRQHQDGSNSAQLLAETLRHLASAEEGSDSSEDEEDEEQQGEDDQRASHHSSSDDVSDVTDDHDDDENNGDDEDIEVDVIGSDSSQVESLQSQHQDSTSSSSSSSSGLGSPGGQHKGEHIDDTDDSSSSDDETGYKSKTTSSDDIGSHKENGNSWTSSSDSDTTVSSTRYQLNMPSSPDSPRLSSDSNFNLALSAIEPKDFSDSESDSGSENLSHKSDSHDSDESRVSHDNSEDSASDENDDSADSESDIAGGHSDQSDSCEDDTDEGDDKDKTIDSHPNTTSDSEDDENHSMSLSSSSNSNNSLQISIHTSNNVVSQSLPASPEGNHDRPHVFGSREDGSEANNHIVLDLCEEVLLLSPEPSTTNTSSRKRVAPNDGQSSSNKKQCTVQAVTENTRSAPVCAQKRSGEVETCSSGDQKKQKLSNQSKVMPKSFEIPPLPSDDSDSDSSWQPPENISSDDETLSDFTEASTDSNYEVFVPKTAAQLLEEYQSCDSDSTWNGRD